MDRTAILFVCTGNICRSPTAHGIFRKMVRDAGLEKAFLIDSAGTHGYHVGDPPDPRAVETACLYGVDISDLRARKMTAADFSLFDYILAMDSGHYTLLSDMRRQSPAGKATLERFDAADVADPYYADVVAFRNVYAHINQGCVVWMDKILKNFVKNKV